MSKIKLNRKVPQALFRVEDLDIGQVFYDGVTDGFYLALEEYCLCLESFAIVFDESFGFVQPVEATITID